MLRNLASRTRWTRAVIEGPKVKVHLIRLGSLAAVLAGALRALTSFLPPTTDRIMTLYLIVDVLLLFGCVGLYEFQRVTIRFLETLAVLLEILGGLVLIARDLALLRSAVIQSERCCLLLASTCLRSARGGPEHSRGGYLCS
jgi:hypothetical protein